jgi:uncharacterized protein
MSEQSPPGVEQPAVALEAAAAAPGAHMVPVRVSDRIEFIDVLRGVALFGILAANMRGLNAPSAIYGHNELLFPGFADRFVQGLIDTFISGKFITIFACLFGLGFAVQMSRAEARGVSVGSFYPRRLLVLLGFGVIHGALIWWGDILIAYALIGFVLLAFRTRSPKLILDWAWGILLGAFFTLSLLLAAEHFRGPRPPAAHPQREPQEIARVVRVFNEGPPAARAAENFRAWTVYAAKDAGVLAFLPTFLFGLWLWRRGVVQDLAAHEAALRKVCVVTLPAGVALNAFHVVVDGMRGSPVPHDLLFLVTKLASYYGPFVLAAGYASGLALLALRAEWHRRLAFFAPVGRMALTNYLMQSVVCVAFFTSTGLYGKVGPAWGLVPTVVLYAAQVWLSNWWLARYRFGPMEYAWRTLTYGRLGPLRREPAAA